MNLPSLRQSDNWFQYMKFLGWKRLETKSGIKIAILKTPMGTVTKIQRPPKFTKKDLEEIEKLCVKSKAMFIKIEPSDKVNAKMLENAGFKLSGHPLCPPSTLIIDLTKSEKELWADLSKSGKYSVNRAKREGSTVEFIRNPTKKESDEHYELIKETSKRNKFYLQPYVDFLERVKIFKEDAILAIGRNEKEEVVGVKVFIADRGQATFLNGGTSEVGRKGKWGYDLLWQSILYLKSKGYTLLDLEGIDDPRFVQFTRDWGGFSHFKEKFGGTVVRFPRPYIKYLSWPLRALSKLLPLPL